MLGPAVDIVGVIENAPAQRAIFLPPITVQPIQLTRWQDTTLRFQIYEAGGQLADLTGFTLVWTVRKNSKDGGFILRKTGVPQPLRSKGAADVAIAATDWRGWQPGRFVFDAALTGPSSIQVVPVSPLELRPGMVRSP